MKKIFAAHLLSFLLLPISITALPQGERVIEGEAEFYLDGNTYAIHAADKTIISYDSFNVGKQEELRIIQPSKDATLLNRVIGPDPSQILGNISSNGKIFLVNPHGVYFGKNATVDTGSLIVSTLDILDQDFLENRFSFHAKEGISGFIYNEGMISASDVVLISPHIKNEGVIHASINKVVLASGEAVTLTFSGDGLMSFEIKEGVKEGFIEHLGSIEAQEVFIRVAQAKEMMQNVINLDGLVEGNILTEENGKVRIARQSSIKARDVFIEGDKVSIEGKIDVSSETRGGTLHILGDHLELRGAAIDATGGTVLIGGEYKGEGTLRAALTNFMDETSCIRADGKGSRVILWSDDTTVFNGKIFAKDGFVETSGKKILNVLTGHVTAETWLLDPTNLVIASSGGASLPLTCAGVGTSTLSTATIAAATANVILCATSTITQNADAAITVPTGFTLSFQGSGGTISTTLNTNITTHGQTVTFTNTSVTLGSSVTIDTTNAGGSTGANITFDSTATIDGDHNLTLTVGTGTVSFGADIGASTPLSSLTVTGGTVTQIATSKIAGALSYTGSAAINIEGNITTGGGTIDMIGPVTLSGDPTFDATDSGDEAFGANITFTGTLNGSTSLTLKAGDAGIVEFSGITGGSAALTNAIFTSAGLIEIGANFTVDGSNTLNFSEAVRIMSTATIASNGADINFNETVNGTHALTILGGAGTVTFSEPVGTGLPLTSLALTSSNIVQNSSVTSSGAVTYTNTALALIDGNITAGSFTQSGGGTVSLGASITATSTIHFTNTITFNAAISLTASGAGGIVLNSTMIPTIDGAFNLTFFALAGSITGPQLGSPSEYINTLTLTAKALNVSSIYANNIIENGSETISSDITAPGAYLLFSNPTTVAAGVFTIDVTGGTAPGGVTFASTLDGPGSLAFVIGGGNLTFDGNIGGITAFGDIAIASVQNVMVAGSFIGSSFTQVTGGGTLTIAGTMTTSSSTGVSLTGTIMDITGSITTSASGPVAFDNTDLLTITGSINANGPVSQTGGGTVSLGNTITTTNALAASGAVSFTNPVTLIDDVVINTIVGDADITFGSLATVDGLENFSLIAGSGDISLGAEIGGLTPIDAFTIYSATNLTLPALTASSLLQVAGTGTTTLGGAVTTIGDAGVVIVGNIFNVNAPIETLGKGPIILQNSGLLTISSSATINAASIFLQTGSGSVNVSGNVTAH